MPGKFQIGLAMSGAISAGAYSAGVLDFLFEALAEWEAQRGKQGVPDHRVVLKVISGASAGAIAGALSVIALAKRANAPGRTGCFLPALYHTWVTAPCMVPTLPGRPDDLPNGFLAPDPAWPPGQPPLASLLNARMLDGIAADALAGNGTASAPLPYIAETLHVYMTLTNLRGVPYAIQFGNGDVYGMTAHADRAHYCISGLGSTPLGSAWADDDPGTHLHIAGLSPATPEWREYAMTAVASGAFPIGLAARPVALPQQEYRRRKVTFDLPPGVRLAPAFPTGTPAAVGFTAVDGGVTDNDPFELARATLMGTSPRTPPASDDGMTADRALIMVSPFNAPPTLPPEGKPAASLLGVAFALLPALIQQARFKPTEIAAALAESIYTRFLIAPQRSFVPPRDATLACGVLGGFGGFLCEAFRAHDFQLGRRNCQRFLAENFTLPIKNPLFAAGNFQVSGTDGSHARIIPLYGNAAAAVPKTSWPTMSACQLAELRRHLKIRYNSLAESLGRSAGGWQWPVRAILRAVRCVALARINRSIRQSLCERHQLSSCRCHGCNRSCWSALRCR